jgi:hypothetical protein
MASKSRLLDLSVQDLTHDLSTNCEWTLSEIDILEKNYKNQAMDSLIKKLPRRTERAILKMAGNLGLTHATPNWTQQEINALIANYGKMSNKKLGAMLSGRSITAIKIMAVRLKLKGDKPKWTAEEIDILRQYCGVETFVRIKERLPGRSYQSILWKSKSLGLCKTAPERRPNSTVKK